MPINGYNGYGGLGGLFELYPSIFLPEVTYMERLIPVYAWKQI